ncbi:hypothetical protein [Halalkalibacter urbisdiaboli]|uniref:hypothetical protein n=1 Tax=Halalkalibacter urbisdiaboli TaxID=1960589 RepID=UPI000B451194|nr:hypothetical protein [Halalkalibacter urbisdiaboli]
MSARKRFGLDIDGTVTDPNTFVPHLNKHFNRNLTLDDLTEYDLTSILDISEQEFWEWMGKHEGLIYEQANLAPYAETILHEWTKYHDLIYITARREHHAKRTREWFETKKLPFDHIELVGKHDKLEAVRAHDIDIFFEDKHDNAVAIAEEFQIPVILIDTPYNRLPIPENVIRIYNWKEAKEWVDEWIMETT